MEVRGRMTHPATMPPRAPPRMFEVSYTMRLLGEGFTGWKWGPTSNTCGCVAWVGKGRLEPWHEGRIIELECVGWPAH